MTFPVGYHLLHPDTSLNFQMNRWFGWVGEADMLEEMRAAAPRITNYADWKREFVALAEHATQQGNVLRAGFYWRSAEFFMQTDDPARKGAREKFLDAMKSVYASQQGERHAVPYADGRVRAFLPAYRFKQPHAKCAVVFFGGFDSCIEEVTSALIYLRDAGYDVIALDGPGQGGALDEFGLHMTTEWHKPVSAVLDHFQLEKVALIGLSLGGCLALRAASLESRVQYVIAYDVLTSFSEVTLRQIHALPRAFLKAALMLGASNMLNWMVARVARNNPVVQWGVHTGMHVTGTNSAFEFLRRTEEFQTADISASIRQDVLLLAGREDHYVPVAQWDQQIRMLKNARSITARLFTKSECAENHCQVGNYGLALRTIVSWLDETILEDSR